MISVAKTYSTYIYATNSEGFLLNTDSLKDYFIESASSFSRFADACKQLNGSWNIVVETGSTVFFASDHRATQPLFYRVKNKNIYFSDNAFDLIFENERFEIDKYIERFFSLNGFLLKDDTLHPEIKRVEAGMALMFEGGEITKYFYDKDIIKAKEKTDLSYQQAKQEFKHLLEDTFRKAKEIIGNRAIVLPLTAGRDSRLIACLLKKSGFTNVHCITYGIGEACFENIKAKEIAKRLGFRHRFIASIPQNFGYDGYTQDEEIINYLKYICSLSSGYYFAEYMPSKWILDNFPKDMLPVVIPGHNGDEIRGESFIHSFLLDKDSKRLISYLTLRDGGNRVVDNKEYRLIFKDVASVINGYPSHFDTLRKYDHYLNYEVMPKFYTNSSKSWRYFQIPIFLPFLDKDLCRFLYSMPINYRWGRQLYEEISNEYFSDYAIQFADDVDTKKMMSSISFKIKDHLRPLFARILNRKCDLWGGDTIGFEKIMGGKLLDDVETKSHYKARNVNGLASAWILLKIKEWYCVD